MLLVLITIQTQTEQTFHPSVVKTDEIQTLPLPPMQQGALRLGVSELAGGGRRYSVSWNQVSSHYWTENFANNKTLSGTVFWRLR